MIQIQVTEVCSCNDPGMSLWILILLIILFVVFARVDSRDYSGRPARKWNFWIGPSPQDGEKQARFMLRRALASLAAFSVVALILYFVPSIPDERAGFRGDESIVSLVVFILCAPLALMAFVVFAVSLFRTAILAIFRRGYVFDESAGKFRWPESQSVPR